MHLLIVHCVPLVMLAEKSKLNTYVWVRREVPPRQTTYVAKGNRAAVKLAVALIPSNSEGQRVVVRTVTGTTTNTELQPRAYYLDARGKRATGLSGAEYLDFLKEVFPKRQYGGRRSHPMVLVHDKYPSHNVKAVRTFLNSKGIINAMLPPRCPDLMPLDYCVFANAKRPMKQASASSVREFADQCRGFMHALQQVDAVASTEGFPRRLDKVIGAQGGHIPS
jgi:hypothetical protein